MSISPYALADMHEDLTYCVPDEGDRVLVTHGKKTTIFTVEGMYTFGDGSSEFRNPLLVDYDGIVNVRSPIFQRAVKEWRDHMIPLKAVAEMVGVAYSTLRTYVARDEDSPVKPVCRAGGLVYIHRDVVTAYIIERAEKG